jgi:hypothetical protein
VSPYREPAEDTEARRLEREIDAFRAALARHARRVRIGVLVALAATTLGLVAGAAWIAEHTRRVQAAITAPRPSICEERVLTTADGAPVRMTVCH